MFGLLDRYLFREWLKVFLMALIVILGLLLLESFYEDLPDLLEFGANPRQILTYFAVLLPSFLPLVLPVSLLVSILFALGVFHKHSEIVAMRSCGLSLFRISRSIWMAGLALTFVLFFLNAEVVPRSVELSRQIRDSVRFAHEERATEDGMVGLVEHLSFDHRREGRLWFMNRFSERAFVGIGVSVFSRDAAGREYYRISSREAVFEEETGHWIFLDGREVDFNPAGEPIRSRGFERLEMPEYRESPRLMLALNKRPKDLSLNELRAIIREVSPAENPRVQGYLVQYHDVMAAPFSCLVVVGLAVPFAVAGVRTSPMVGVSKSVGYFILFYFFSSLFFVLGERGLLPAILAAWLPYVVMLGVGGFLLYRAR